MHRKVEENNIFWADAEGGVGVPVNNDESMDSGSEAACDDDDGDDEDEEGEEEGRDRAWNAAGLAPRATQVLVAGRRSLVGEIHACSASMIE